MSPLPICTVGMPFKYLPVNAICHVSSYYKLIDMTMQRDFSRVMHVHNFSHMTPLLLYYNSPHVTHPFKQFQIFFSNKLYYCVPSQYFHTGLEFFQRWRYFCSSRPLTFALNFIYNKLCRNKTVSCSSGVFNQLLKQSLRAPEKNL